MKIFWQRFLAALTPGVRILLILMSAAFFLALAGRLTHTLDLPRWLAMGAPDFRHGQIWRMVTYALLPISLLDFLMSAVALVWLGSMLERHWTRHELWLYCGIAAAGGGLADALLPAASAPPLAGAAPMTFGLLVAWAFVSGCEIVLIPGFGPLTVLKIVLVSAAVSLLVLLLSAGLPAALVTTAGGLTGLLYLWLRQKWLMTRPSRVCHSERISRLEL